MADRGAQASLVAARAHGQVLAEYTLPSHYRWPWVIRALSMAALTALLAGPYAFGRPTFPPVLVIAGVSGIGALYNAAVALWRGRFRTRVTTSGIEICGYFNHFVPWDQVRGMNTSGYGGSRSIDDRIEARGYRGFRGNATSGRRARLATLRVVRMRGHAMLLRAPLVTSWAPDPDFDAKARELRQFCVEYARGSAA